eukprot:gene12111-2869_t
MDPITVGLAVYSLYSVAKRGMKIADINEKIDELEDLYAGLPDKRCRPGPAIRKLKAKLESAKLKQFLTLGLSALPFGDIAGDIADISSELSDAVEASEQGEDWLEGREDWEWDDLNKKLTKAGLKKLKKRRR